MAGKDTTPETEKGRDAVLTAMEEALKANPAIQFAGENPGFSTLRDDKRIKAMMGEGIVVSGCAYGRKNMKPYRIWLTPGAAKHFKPVHPASSESLCPACKGETDRHEQAACPRRGDSRPREKEKGCSVQASKNRVPPKLAAAVAEAMLKARVELSQ